MQSESERKQSMYAQEYCTFHEIEVEGHDWIGPGPKSIWISYPDGRDVVYADGLDDKEAKLKYFEACQYAMEIWEEVLKEKRMVPPPPPLPPVPKVPKFPSVPLPPPPLPPIN